ncbi:MAG: ribose 5-phosphate isomerase B [Firmicutes bacterium]|nr:ribose 5-phosphate isomerase B [Bacillota bacterium]
MKIAIGCDHAGLELKEKIVKHLQDKKIEITDMGTNTPDSVDYPIYGKKVAHAVTDGSADLGIVVCGTGIGISIAANKVKGARAALCHDVFSAKATREHNNANILAMGARVIGVGPALEVVDAFLSASFSNDERHIKRINMLEEE